MRRFVLGLLAAGALWGQQRLEVSPAVPRPFVLTEEGGTGKRVIAVPTATPPGRYEARLGEERWTVDVAAPDAVPASIHPPAVLLNGWQIQTLAGACPVRPSSGSFGRLEELLRAQGRPVLFFDNCRECPGGSIEDCALALKEFLEAQRTQGGDPVAEFDLIGHSMGGLITRAYLAGMFPQGWFPPADHRVRKAVLIAAPNFGAYTIASVDRQTRQMQEGSRFQWELATWHQGADDLRGVDALSIAGAAHGGTGDGVVSLLSASLGFARDPARTRVLDYCHTGSFNLLLFCGFSRTGIAEVDGAGHLTYRLVDAFLNDRNEWRFLGLPANLHPWLRTRGAGIGWVLDAEENPLAATPAQTEAVEAGDTEFTFRRADGSTFTLVTAVEAGAVRPRLFKYGPVIGRVRGVRGGPGLELEAGQVIEILGQRLAGATVEVNRAPMEVVEASDERVRVAVPGQVDGMVWLQVRTAEGSHTVRVMFRRLRR